MLKRIVKLVVISALFLGVLGQAAPEPVIRAGGEGPKPMLCPCPH